MNNTIDKQTVIQQLENKQRIDLCYLPDEHKADRDIALAAVQKDGLNLHYFPLFNNDKEIVKTAVSLNAYSLIYVGKEMQDNREIAVTALLKNQQSYLYISPRLRQDISLTMSAVLRDGLLLHYADASLKDEESVVLAAIKENGNALEYASERLKNMSHIVEAAVKKNGEALCYAPDIFKNDINYIKMALQSNGHLIEYYNQYQDNKEMALLAVSAHGNAIAYLSDRLKNDSKVAYIAYCNDINAFDFMGCELKDEVQTAQKQNGISIKEYLKFAADAQDLRDELEPSTVNHSVIKRRKI